MTFCMKKSEASHFVFPTSVSHAVIDALHLAVRINIINDSFSFIIKDITLTRFCTVTNVYSMQVTEEHI